MDGNSRLIIAFFILFIRSGLSDRHGSFGYQPPSTSYNPQGFGASFGDGQTYATQIGGNREGGNRRVSDSSSWNSASIFGSSNAEDNRKISPAGNVNDQWNGGSGWNTGGYGGSAGGAFGSSSDSKDQGWNFGSQNEERNPVVQTGKEESHRKTNSNSRKPGGSTSDISFSFQNEDTKRRVESEYGSSFGFDSKRPQTSTSSGGNSSWGSSPGSARPLGSSSSSGEKKLPNWSSSNQNGNSNTDAFDASGFSSLKREENQRRPSFGSSSGSKKPQGDSSSNGGDLSWGSDSESKRNQGGSSGSSSNWGSGTFSNFQRPPNGIINGGHSDWGFGSDSDSKESSLSLGSDSKRPQWSSSSSSNSNWESSPGFGMTRPQGSSITSSNDSDSARKRPHIGEFLNFGSNPDEKKPHGSNNGSNSGSNLNSNKPQTNSGNSGSGYPPPKQPEGGQKRPGNNRGFENQKPNGNGNANSNKSKAEEVDWSRLELENQQSSLTFDLSELWRPNDKKDFAWKSIWTRTRFRRDGDSDNAGISCQCMEYSACAPHERIDVLKFLRHDDQNLRVSIMECATKKKICCITSKHRDSGATHSTCGKRMTKLAEHDISNDGSANYGDFPWVLRLVAVGDDGEETVCSASLIHNSVALTTASCALLLTGKNVRIRSGEWNVFGGNDKSKREETTIGKIYLHPEFDVVTYRKDLALLFLDTPLHYKRGPDTICLPTPRDIWDASKCVVVGWTEKNGSVLKSAMLKQVDLDTVAQGKCRHRDGLKNGLSDLEDPGYLCAHSRKDDPYVGDNGASLFCPLYKTGEVIQVGFVSNSPPGKLDYKTSTFTDIFDSLDWIYRMVGNYTFVTGEDAAD